jgi:hypothetical protein
MTLVPYRDYERLARLELGMPEGKAMPQFYAGMMEQEEHDVKAERAPTRPAARAISDAYAVEFLSVVRKYSHRDLLLRLYHALNDSRSGHRVGARQATIKYMLYRILTALAELNADFDRDALLSCLVDLLRLENITYRHIVMSLKFYLPMFFPSDAPKSGILEGLVPIIEMGENLFVSWSSMPKIRAAFVASGVALDKTGGVPAAPPLTPQGGDAPLTPHLDEPIEDVVSQLITEVVDVPVEIIEKPAPVDVPVTTAEPEQPEGGLGGARQRPPSLPLEQFVEQPTDFPGVPTEEKDLENEETSAPFETGTEYPSAAPVPDVFALPAKQFYRNRQEFENVADNFRWINAFTDILYFERPVPESRPDADEIKQMARVLSPAQLETALAWVHANYFSTRVFRERARDVKRGEVPLLLIMRDGSAYRDAAAKFIAEHKSQYPEMTYADSSGESALAYKIRTRAMLLIGLFDVLAQPTKTPVTEKREIVTRHAAAFLEYVASEVSSANSQIYSTEITTLKTLLDKRRAAPRRAPGGGRAPPLPNLGAAEVTPGKDPALPEINIEIPPAPPSEPQVAATVSSAPQAEGEAPPEQPAPQIEKADPHKPFTRLDDVKRHAFAILGAVKSTYKARLRQIAELDNDLLMADDFDAAAEGTSPYVTYTSKGRVANNDQILTEAWGAPMQMYIDAALEDPDVGTYITTRLARPPRRIYFTLAKPIKTK